MVLHFAASSLHIHVVQEYNTKKGDTRISPKRLSSVPGMNYSSTVRVVQLSEWKHNQRELSAVGFFVCPASPQTPRPLHVPHGLLSTPASHLQVAVGKRDGNMKMAVTRNVFCPELTDSWGQFTQTGALFLQIHRRSCACVPTSKMRMWHMTVRGGRDKVEVWTAFVASLSWNLPIMLVIATLTLTKWALGTGKKGKDLAVQGKRKKDTQESKENRY